MTSLKQWQDTVSQESLFLLHVTCDRDILLKKKKTNTERWPFLLPVFSLPPDFSSNVSHAIGTRPSLHGVSLKPEAKTRPFLPPSNQFLVRYGLAFGFPSTVPWLNQYALSHRPRAYTDAETYSPIQMCARTLLGNTQALRIVSSPRKIVIYDIMNKTLHYLKFSMAQNGCNQSSLLSSLALNNSPRELEIHADLLL